MNGSAQPTSTPEPPAATTSASPDASDASAWLGDRAWGAFAAADSAEAMCRSWLAVLCSMTPGVQVGLLLLQSGDGSYVPAAAWPEGTELQRLAGIAKECLASRAGVRRQLQGQPAQLAYPLVAGNDLHGAVVLELGDDSEAVSRLSARLTHWGAGWMANLFDQRQLRHTRRRLDESGFIFDVALGLLAEQDFARAALTVVNRLAERHACQQVRLAMANGLTLELVAVSHSAWFDPKATQSSLAREAMVEAFDQRTAVVWPLPDSREGEEAESTGLPDDGAAAARRASMTIHAAHARYSRQADDVALCTWPLVADGGVGVGSLSFERREPFLPTELPEIERLCAVLAPLLLLKRARDESLWAHAGRSLRHAVAACTDASHPGLKLAGALVVVLLLAGALWPVTHRVSAPAVLEGAVTMALVSPFDGYLRDAPVRAGDKVARGQLMARLEDRDLLLEKLRWETELEMAHRKEREAMAQSERVNQRLASAQADQALAQLELTVSRLARVQLVAPFDGVVVKGDLSQQLGAPMETGKLMFEVSPLDAWRVMLKVDERDIGFVRAGQSGQLLLTGVPGRHWPFKVRSVTPVAAAEEGRNTFRVEARLDDAAAAAALRPNLEGVAKVEVGERSLLWIWTHRFTDWLRFAWWQWAP